MNIVIGDIVTLSDKNEYTIANVLEYAGIIYYYIADINNPANLKFCFIDGDEFVEVKNGDLILKLISLFNTNISF